MNDMLHSDLMTINDAEGILTAERNHYLMTAGILTQCGHQLCEGARTLVMTPVR